VEIIHFLDDLNQPYSCNAWGAAGSIGIPPIVDDGTINTIFNWFNNPNGSGIYPLIIFLDHAMEIVNIIGSSPSLNVSNIIIEAMLDAIPVDIEGCIDESACNYNSAATMDDGSCKYIVDCVGVCGGSAEVDACGTCGGSITDATQCVCPDGEVEDCTGVCGGNAVVDICGVCNGNGCHNQNCTTYPSSVYDCDGAKLSLYNGILPDKFDIISIYPNPFNPVVNINFEIAKSDFISGKIYNLDGQLIETLFSEYKSIGSYNLKWNAESMHSGIYFISLKSGDKSLTEKVENIVSCSVM